MASTTLNTRIALKVDTSVNWSSSELILMKGEIGIESDTRKFKIGDGTNKWSALAYAAQLPNIVSEENPTNADATYDIGTIWLNKTTGNAYIMQSNTPDSAVWIQLAKKSDVDAAGKGDMLKSVYDTNDDGSVNKADSLKSGDSFLSINDADTSGLWTAEKISSELGNKADATAIADMLTKTEASSTYAKIANTYNKSEVDGFLGNKADKSQLTNYIPTSEKGTTNGVATLDESGKVPSSQLPSFVDDVIESNNFAALPETGEAGKIYVTLDTNKTYRWGGSAYVEISASLALGETTGTAYEGSKGKANATAITALQGNVSTIQSTIEGLGALATKDTVSSAEIDANAVTTEKIANSNITAAKLATDSVETSKIKNGAVTNEKITSVDAKKLTQSEEDYLVLNCGNATA